MCIRDSHLDARRVAAVHPRHLPLPMGWHPPPRPLLRGAHSYSLHHLRALGGGPFWYAPRHAGRALHQRRARAPGWLRVLPLRQPGRALAG
eukprot:8894620-Alexandrium_andersonii.AAC.1